MSGDVQVRFCESLRVKFPWATRLLIFAKTKRQLSRCRRRMMDVLHERRLSLSRKKSRMGCIKGGFHFLGIDYLPTRTEDNTNMTHINDAAITPANNVHYLNENGGG
jgi:RNA-directed DNA polymerase